MENLYNETEQKIVSEAEVFARTNKKEIAKKYIDGFNLSTPAISIFMAGSPGAGKTEFSKVLLSIYKDLGINDVIRIDPDDLRINFQNYTGSNSYLFQGPISILTDAVHDEVLDKSLSFLLDGTMSNLKKSMENIKRSISKGRKVYIYYIYQEPEVAWKFTQEREKVEGRRILKETFINGLVNSRDNIRILKQTFGNKISVSLVYKEYTSNKVNKIIEIENVENFETYFDKWYNADDIEKIL